MPYIDAYPDSGRNQIYNLLFADDEEAFAAAETGDPATVAADETAESRLRVVAYRRLASAGKITTVPWPLLGVIVEIALDEGLDTLAAYADGSVRYINHAGGMSVIEPGPLSAQAEALMLAAEPVVAAIGPWEGDRQPPPPRGQARLTFLVGGQIYFGQGPFGALAGDAMAGSVITAATTLLTTVSLMPR